MWVRTGNLLLLTAVVIGGCSGRWNLRPAKPQPRTVATTMPAEKAVKLFEEALDLVTDLQYQQAGEKFRRVVDPLDEVGDHRRAAEAVFWLAYCREKQRYLPAAAKLYKRLIEKFPDSPASRRAAERLAALEGKTGQP